MYIYIYIYVNLNVYIFFLDHAHSSPPSVGPRQKDILRLLGGLLRDGQVTCQKFGETPEMYETPEETRGVYPKNVWLTMV